MGCLSAPFTLVVELVEAKHRRLASMGLMVAISVGEALVGVSAWFIPNWRDYHYYTTIPLLLIVLIQVLVAESPRWLNRKRKYKELYSMFKAMAKMNKSEVPIQLKEKFEIILNNHRIESISKEVIFHDGVCFKNDNKHNDKKEKISPIQMLRDPKLRLYTIVMFFNWVFVTLGNYYVFQVL